MATGSAFTEWLAACRTLLPDLRCALVREKCRGCASERKSPTPFPGEQEIQAAEEREALQCEAAAAAAANGVARKDSFSRIPAAASSKESEMDDIARIRREISRSNPTTTSAEPVLLNKAPSAVAAHSARKTPLTNALASGTPGLGAALGNGPGASRSSPDSVDQLREDEYGYSEYE